MPVSDEHLRQIRRYLEPGETVAWAGQPSPTRSVLSGFAMWLFAVPWTLFSLFWMAMAGGMTWLGDGGPSGVGSIFPLFGLPFVLVGLWMLSAPFRAWRKAQRTVYVVTNQRAIVGQAEGGGFTIEGFRPDELTDLALTVRADGSGTIDLRNESRRAADLAATTARSARTKHVPGRPGIFADIPDVERVFDLLRTLARTAAPPLLSVDPYAADPYATRYSSDADRYAAEQAAAQARRNASDWRRRLGG